MKCWTQSFSCQKVRQEEAGIATVIFKFLISMSTVQLQHGELWCVHGKGKVVGAVWCSPLCKLEVKITSVWCACLWQNIVTLTARSAQDKHIKEQPSFRQINMLYHLGERAHLIFNLSVVISRVKRTSDPSLQVNRCPYFRLSTHHHLFRECCSLICLHLQLPTCSASYFHLVSLTVYVSCVLVSKLPEIDIEITDCSSHT